MKSVKMAVTGIDLLNCLSAFKANERDKWSSDLNKTSEICNGFSLKQGSKAQRNVSSSASPADTESGSVDCCHLDSSVAKAWSP